MAETGKFTLTVIDDNGEPTTHGVLTNPADTGIEWDALLALMVAYKSSIDDIILGADKRRQYGAIYETLLPVRPANGAQREVKYLIRYRNLISNEFYRVELGTPKLDDVVFLTESRYIDLTAGNFPAFVTAFDNMVKAPDGSSDDCELVSMEIVGRNT